MIHPQSITLALRCVADCLFGGLVTKQETEGFYSGIATATEHQIEMFLQFIEDLGEGALLEMATYSISIKIKTKDNKYTVVEGVRFSIKQQYEDIEDLIFEIDIAKAEDVDKWVHSLANTQVEPIQIKHPQLQVKNGLTVDADENSSEDDDDDYWL